VYRAIVRLADSLVSFLAENRLLPQALMARRQRKRIRFLRSLGISGGTGAEIGVQKGFFSHTLLRELSPQRLHLIDPWYLLGDKWEWASGNKSTNKAVRNVLYWFRRELSAPAPRVALHIGFDEDVLQQFPDHYFDWVYLDTSHEYEPTKVELSLLSKKVKPEGIILGDDWFSDPSHLFYGQYRAVTEFVRDFGYSIVYASDTDHQWAIRKA